MFNRVNILESGGGKVSRRRGIGVFKSLTVTLIKLENPLNLNLFPHFASIEKKNSVAE